MLVLLIFGFLMWGFADVERFYQECDPGESFLVSWFSSFFFLTVCICMCLIECFDIWDFYFVELVYTEPLISCLRLHSHFSLREFSVVF